MIEMLLSFVLLDVDTRLDYGRELAFANMHYESSLVLKTVPDGATKNFFLTVNAFNSNNKGKALTYLDRFDRNTIFEDVPERYLVVAALMREQLQTWKEDLADVGRDMNNVAGRLDKAKANKETRRVQQEIVRKLDKEIKNLESQAAAASKSQDAGKSEAKPQQPLPDTSPADTSGPGKVTAKSYTDESKAWGKLPEKERTRSMMKKVETMPAAHRKMIEDYYKRIASESK